MGDFIICEPEERKLNSWNQTLVMWKKAAIFRSFFPHVLEVAQTDFARREIQQLTVLYAHCPESTEHLTIFLRLKHGTSIAIPTHLKILANGPYRAIIQLCGSSFKHQQFDVTRAGAFRVGCPNILFFCSVLKHISDDHQYPQRPIQRS